MCGGFHRVPKSPDFRRREFLKPVEGIKDALTVRIGSLDSEQRSGKQRANR